MDTSDSLAGSHRSVIITPSSSARGTTLAVMASSVSRMLPGQGYSIITVIRRKGLHCSVLYRYPDMKQKKCSCPRKNFLIFSDNKKAPRIFHSEGQEKDVFSCRNLRRSQSVPFSSFPCALLLHCVFCNQGVRQFLLASVLACASDKFHGLCC